MASKLPLFTEDLYLELIVINASINVKPEGRTTGICGAFDLNCLPHPWEFD